MSQDFYSSGYSMGDPYAQQQDPYAQQQDPYAQQQDPYAQQQDPYAQQYSQAQYNTAAPQAQYSSPQQYGYGGQQQQSPDFYSPDQQTAAYSTPQQQQQYAGYDNQSFYSTGTNSYYDPTSNMGSMGPAPTNTTSDSFEDEPPLMEELGIDLQQIYQTTMTVLNPSKPAATNLMDDPDLSGPLMFCLGFGSLLLLSGKIHFGYIYGVALIGAGAMYALLNLMSVNGVSASVTVSVLGYCMLPMCVLAGISALLSLKGTIGLILCALTVSWASFASSKLFVSVLAMYDQQPLVAYPCALMYGIFAVLTVF